MDLSYVYSEPKHNKEAGNGRIYFLSVWDLFPGLRFLDPASTTLPSKHCHSQEDHQRVVLRLPQASFFPWMSSSSFIVSSFYSCLLLVIPRMFLTTILLLQLRLLLYPSLTSLPPSFVKQNSLHSESSLVLISFQESSTTLLSTISLSPSSILVDAGKIMSHMKKKMKNKKCTPEIVAIKKTRIVPVAVPVKSYSMPDSYSMTPPAYSAPAANVPAPPSKTQTETYQEDETEGYEEEEEEDDDSMEGAYASGGYGDVDDSEVAYEEQDYRRRTGDLQYLRDNRTAELTKKMGQIMNDRIFRSTFENPPIASNPLVDFLVSRKHQADIENARKYSSSTMFANSFNHLQQRTDTPLRQGTNYHDNHHQTPPHYSHYTTPWNVDQELR